MKVGDKIKVLIEQSGETRFCAVERVYGSNVILRVITEEAAGQDAKRVTIRRLHQAK